jgi:hypothetical protein
VLRDAADRVRREDGAGLVSALFGFVVFLGFLLVASQVLVHLYTTSTVSAAVYDAARRAAAEDGGGCAWAPGRVRALLGPYGQRGDVAVRCAEVDGVLRLTVAGPSPARGAAAAGGRLPSLATIERTVTVRVEPVG